MKPAALASFPGSPSFRAIIPRMTFDPPEGKAEGEPGRPASCYVTHTLGIDDVGPACSSMAPVPLLGISQAL